MMTDTFRQGETWERVMVLETDDGAALDLAGYAFAGQLRTGPGKLPAFVMQFTLVAHPTTGAANHAVRLALDDAITAGMAPTAYQADIFATPPGGEPFAIPLGTIHVTARITAP